MGKYVSVIVGAAVAILGLAGLFRWSSAFVTMLKGTIPAMFIIGGIIALIAGVSEIKDEMASKKEEKKEEEKK